MMLVGYTGIDSRSAEIEIQAEYSSVIKNQLKRSLYSPKIYIQKAAGQNLLYKVFYHLGYNPDLLNTILINDFGKPFIPDSEIFFNISHSYNRVVAIISDENEVGIDVEKIRPISLIGFQDFFSSSNWKIILNSDQPFISLLKHWTVKEAVLKCRGTGFSVNDNDMEIMESKAVVYNNTVNESYYYKTIGLDEEYIISFASANELKSSVSIIEF